MYSVIALAAETAADYDLPGTREPDMDTLNNIRSLFGGDVVLLISVVVALTTLLIGILYFVLSRRRNKEASETIFLVNKKKVSYNRILSLYHVLSNFGPTRKFVKRLKMQFEIITPGDERMAKERAIMVSGIVWLISFIMFVFLVIIYPSIYMILCSIYTVFVVSSSLVNSIVSSNEKKLMTQFQKFLSRFRYYYLTDNTVDDAIYDAIGDVPYLMQLHAVRILRVLQADADTQDEELLHYCSSVPNRFLKQFMVICMTTMQNGDLKVDNQSLCLTNIKNLKIDIQIDMRKKRNIWFKFAGMIPMSIIPIYTMPAIERWGVYTVPDMQSFYYGLQGTLVQVFCFATSVISYVLISRMKEAYQIEPGDHFVLKELYRLKPVKHFVDNYWNRNYGKKLRVDNVLRRTGSPLGAEHFLLQQISLMITAYILVIAVFLIGNVSTKNYVDTNFTAVADDTGSATEEQYIIMMILTKYYYNDYKNRDIVMMYNQATGSNADGINSLIEEWFFEHMSQRFKESGALLSEKETVQLIQQYNTLYSTTTRLYTKMFGTSGFLDPNDTDEMTVKAFNQLRQIMTKAARKDPLINTDGLYEKVQKNIYEKVQMYQNIYLHWYSFAAALAGAVLAFIAPMRLLRFKERELQERMEDEVIQFQSIILLLIYFDSVNVSTVMEWLHMFSDVFSRSLERCIGTFTMDEQKALQELYDAEPFESFQRIVENLMMVDDVGILQAFNELEASRASSQEIRDQENEISVTLKSNKASMLSAMPLYAVVLGYLVIPFFMTAFKQLTNLVNEMSTM